MRALKKKIDSFVSKIQGGLFQVGTFIPLAQTPSGPLSDLYNRTGDFSVFVNKLFAFMIAIGAIAAVLRIAYAGYLYMGQSDMWSSKGQAKAILSDVTLGLLLLLSIYLILNQINPAILSLDAFNTLNLPEAKLN